MNHGARPFLDGIKGATQRATGVTRQLLAVTRRPPFSRRSDLDASVKRSAACSSALLATTSSSTCGRHQSPALVNAEAGLIDQVLLNLAVNARGAMPAGGLLTVRSRSPMLMPAHSRASA